MKLIRIPDEIVEDLKIIAVKENRREKTDLKNFIEDLLVSYVGKQKKRELTKRKVK